MSDRERFTIDGVGCWCPGALTLATLRIMGHTESCTQARVGWRANMRHLSELDKQRRIETEIGRQFIAAAQETTA